MRYLYLASSAFITVESHSEDYGSIRFQWGNLILGVHIRCLSLSRAELVLSHLSLLIAEKMDQSNIEEKIGRDWNPLVVRQNHSTLLTDHDER